MLSEVLTGDTSKTPEERHEQFRRLTKTIYSKASLKDGPGEHLRDALSPENLDEKPPVKSDCLYTYLDGGYPSVLHANIRIPVVCQEGS